MKVKNIVFSGFAAAILMGTAAASAATFNIASKDYVDSKVSALSENGGAIDTVADAVDTLSGQINGNGGLADKVSSLGETVNGDPDDANDNGLVGDVSALENTVGDGQLANGFSNGVDDLTEAVNDLQSTKQDALTAGTNVNITNNVISATDTTYTAGTGITIDSNNNNAIAVNAVNSTAGIAATSSASDTAFPTEKAVAAALATKMGLPDPNTCTPSNDGSNYCVLTMGPNNTLYWANVTAPFSVQ